MKALGSGCPMAAICGLAMRRGGDHNEDVNHCLRISHIILNHQKPFGDINDNYRSPNSDDVRFFLSPTITKSPGESKWRPMLLQLDEARLVPALTPWHGPSLRRGQLVRTSCFWDESNHDLGIGRYGGFLKQGYPQIIHFNGIFHHKPTIFGGPPCQETSIYIYTSMSCMYVM